MVQYNRVALAFLKKLLSYACILWLQTEEAGGSADKQGSTLIPQSNNTA
jgi:hypothetical protein